MKILKILIFIFISIYIGWWMGQHRSELPKNINLNFSKPENIKTVLSLEDIRKMGWKRDIFDSKTIVKNTQEKKHVHIKIAKKKKRITPPNIIVSGIMESKDGNLAIVNRKIVKTGEYILGAKIIKITSNKVSVVKSGTTFTYGLK